MVRPRIACALSAALFLAVAAWGGPSGAQGSVPRAPSAGASAARSGRGVIDGVVTDTNLAPLANATVQVLGSEVSVTTGANGRFRITGLPEGDHLVAARRVGYAQFVSLLTVAAHDTLRPSFSLERFAELGPVVVKAKPVAVRLAEFEARKSLGFGHFLDQAQIDSLRKSFAADLLRTLTQAIQVRSNARGGQFAVSLRGGRLGGTCIYEVFLDGLHQPTPFDLDDLPRPVDIAGIEVYQGPATVPQQYWVGYGNEMCGVILIWTRIGP